MRHIARFRVARAGGWVSFYCKVCGFPVVEKRAEWDGTRRCHLHRPVTARQSDAEHDRVSGHTVPVRGSQNGVWR